MQYPLRRLYDPWVHQSRNTGELTTIGIVGLTSSDFSELSRIVQGTPHYPSRLPVMLFCHGSTFPDNRGRRGRESSFDVAEVTLIREDLEAAVQSSDRPAENWRTFRHGPGGAHEAIYDFMRTPRDSKS